MSDRKPTWRDTEASVYWQGMARLAVPEREQLVDDLGICGRHLRLAGHGEVLVALTTRQELGIASDRLGPLGVLLDAGVIKVLRGGRGGQGEQMIVILVDPADWPAATVERGLAA